MGELVVITEGAITEGAVGTVAKEVGFDELVTVAGGAVLLGTAVNFPPFRQVQALEIFAGVFCQRAAYGGSV